MISIQECFVTFVLLITIYGKTDASMQNKKNILFLASDDMRPALGCYADTHPGFDAPPMHTPNFDALADRSILLERAYVQQAVCSPSRTSLLTGRRPDTTRITDLHHYFREVGSNFTTIPQYFKENGYYSIGAGKIFHSAQDATPNYDYPFSWSEPFYRAKNHWSGNDFSWRALTPEEYNEYPPQDVLNTEFAISKLREFANNTELQKQPFFLALGFIKPHLPFIFPEDFLKYYPEDVVKVPSNHFAPYNMPRYDWSNFGELRGYLDASNEVMGIPDLGLVNVTYPDYKVIELRRAYYSAISYVDYLVGKILDELTNLGLDESTIVSFWGDHGWQLGEHTEWCKHTNFEVATHAPMMIRVPGLTDAGIRTSKLTEFVDLFPTLVEAAGMDPLELCPENSNDVDLCTEGSSLFPLIENPASEEWKEAIFWQYPRGGTQSDNVKSCMGYSIRTENYHYSEWVHIKMHDDKVSWEPEWDKTCNHEELYSELYDLQKDPQENRNVYDVPEYEEIVLELSERLHLGWRNEIKSNEDHSSVMIEII